MSGCAESVIDDEGYAVLVSYSSYAFDVEYVGVRVAESLGIYNLCVGLDGSLEGFEVIHIDNRIADALCGQRVGDEVVRTAIEVVGCDDMVAILHNVLQGVGNGSSTRCYGKTCHTTFEGCDTILKHTLRRVRQTTVDITGITQSETVGGVLRVVEHIAGGLVDGHGTCVGCGVCLFLAYVKL